MSRYKVELCGVDTSLIKVLDNQQMKDYFIALQEGDLTAKEQLINGNLKLVLSMVQRFSARCDNMDDLFQVGCIGLIKAIDNFDLKHEVRFSTYAVPMIMGEIKRYLRDNQGIRISRHCRDLSYQLFKIKEEYIQNHSTEPSLEYLIEQSGAKRKEVVEALDSVQSIVSIFEPMYNSEGDEMMLVDQIKDEHDEIAKLNNLMTLRKSYRRLNSKEMEILQQRYFMDRTQSEIAEELGISQAQVSRLEKSAIANMRKEFEAGL